MGNRSYISELATSISKFLIWKSSLNEEAQDAIGMHIIGCIVFAHIAVYCIFIAYSTIVGELTYGRFWVSFFAACVSCIGVTCIYGAIDSYYASKSRY